MTYFSCRHSRRGLCGPGIRSCRAAFRTAPSRPTGASRCCPPASSIWRRWSHTGCPRAPKTTSAALPRRYGDERIKKKQDSMVINTYVSRLISKANKHIIIHPVHLPLTLLHEDKRSRDFTHSPGNFHLMRHTWVISPSTDGVLAERLLQTFRKRSGSLGGGPDWMKLCVFKAVIVCFPPLSVLGCRSPEKRSVPLDQKVLQWKEWHHLSCSSFEVKNRGSVTQGGPSETQTHHCYLKPRRGEEDFLFRETLKTHSTKRRERGSSLILLPYTSQVYQAFCVDLNLKDGQ